MTVVTLLLVGFAINYFLVDVKSQSLSFDGLHMTLVFVKFQFVVGASLQASLSVCVTSPPLPRALLCVRSPLPCGRRHNSQQVSFLLSIIFYLLSCSGVRLAQDPRMFENSIPKKVPKAK